MKKVLLTTIALTAIGVAVRAKRKVELHKANIAVNESQKAINQAIKNASFKSLSEFT